MSGRFLVTGAAGFIGSHLSERLLADGHRVVGIDRFSPYYDRLTKERNVGRARAHPNFELLEADLAAADLDALLTDADGVFHLAAQPGVRPSWGAGFADYVHDNIVATQCLFEALTRRPVPCSVASSSSVYGDATTLPVAEDGVDLQPVSPYGLTKLTVEHLARIYHDQRGVHIVALRYFTVYGPRQRPDMALTRFARAALDGSPVHVLGDGTQTRDFSYVSDVVDATIRSLGAPSPVYNVGGGDPVSINEVIEALEALTGRRMQIVRAERALGDVGHTWADTTRARSELRWAPQTSLRDGLAAQLAWVEATRAPERRFRSEPARVAIPDTTAVRP